VSEPVDKHERQRLLLESLVAGQQRALENDGMAGPRDRLEQMLGPERLDELDAAVLDVVAAQLREPEPQPTFLETVALAKQAKRETFVGAVLGLAPTDPEPPSRPSGFDGGARDTPPVRRAPDVEHNAWLVEVIRSRAADVGAQF
jgi:hypothetical protein